MSLPVPFMVVIASPAQPGVAIQPLDKLGALSWSKRMDCFVAVLLAMTGRRS